MPGRPTRSGGKNKLPSTLHVLRGTAAAKASRPVTPGLCPLSGPITPPAWLQGPPLDLFHQKAAIYAERGLWTVLTE